MAGQGTMGLEIIEQVQDVDAVIVPVGGGGLIAGVALAIKTLQPKIQIIVSRGLLSVEGMSSIVNFFFFRESNQIGVPVFPGR